MSSNYAHDDDWTVRLLGGAIVAFSSVVFAFLFYGIDGVLTGRWPYAPVTDEGAGQLFWTLTVAVWHRLLTLLSAEVLEFGLHTWIAAALAVVLTMSGVALFQRAMEGMYGRATGD